MIVARSMLAMSDGSMDHLDEFRCFKALLALSRRIYCPNSYKIYSKNRLIYRTTLKKAKAERATRSPRGGFDLFFNKNVRKSHVGHGPCQLICMTELVQSWRLRRMRHEY